MADNNDGRVHVCRSGELLVFSGFCGKVKVDGLAKGASSVFLPSDAGDNQDKISLRGF